MDQVKIGDFIAQRRKSMGLTQKDVALKLMISEKTISKWECGKGLPEVSLMLPLCDILDISVNELLSGRELEDKSYRENAEENLRRILEERSDSKRKIIISFVNALVGAFILTFTVVLSAYLDVDKFVKLIIISVGILTFLFSLVSSIILDFYSGSFECQNCGNSFRPKLFSYFFSAHSLTRRYLKCPKCGKRTGCKRRLKSC